MDIFEYERNKIKEKQSPLASRLRPKRLEDFIGQDHIMGKEKLLYRAIQADKLSSLIFYGPPGTGKTTLAKIIANTTKSDFISINATTSGKQDVVVAIEKAKENLGGYGKKTILFIDEIHRFNKTQQDTLLPHVEDGTVILIGATTENPYFEVNKALISRSLVFELKALEKKDIECIIDRALYSEEGYKAFKADITEDAKSFLADISSGDARVALNAIELAVLTTQRATDGYIHIDLDTMEECVQKRALNYDKDGDNHYDTISAFIKSMRGSDPDAAVYYMARMLYAGEDPKFIARRIMICASEDVGNADPNALLVANAAMNAVINIGLPECRINLAQAAIYTACAPKSNAVITAIDEAFEDVKHQKVTLPNFLRDAHYPGAKELGHGKGYIYPHDYEGNYYPTDYLPQELKGRKYYRPTTNGKEKEISEKLKTLETIKNKNKGTSKKCY
ncbi:MAG: replication-associated recombination protein A [Firmicutes bacterium]|nr:replication-associated recombination protein A [Bacillota bacterium]